MACQQHPLRAAFYRAQRLFASPASWVPAKPLLVRSSPGSSPGALWISTRSSSKPPVSPSQKSSNAWAKLISASSKRISFAPHSAELPSSSKERSEEHTSELQSRGHLVCRLLLEKKKRAYNQRRDDQPCTHGHEDSSQLTEQADHVSNLSKPHRRPRLATEVAAHAMQHSTGNAEN